MPNLNESLMTDFEILNNGHTVQVNTKPWNMTPRLISPVNGKEYYMVQTHFHWSQTDKGSETFLNHVQYPLEVSLSSLLVSITTS